MRLISMMVICILGVVTACDFTTASDATPEPTRDLEPTVQALVSQRLAELASTLPPEATRQTATVSEPTPTPSPTPSLDKNEANKAVQEYLDNLIPDIYPDLLKVATSETHYVGQDIWIAESFAKRSPPDEETIGYILAKWYVFGNGGSPTVIPGNNDAKEWVSFLRSRKELVNWVQITYCLLEEDGQLIEDWNKSPSPLTDAQLDEFRERQKSIRDRLWNAHTPKLGREIRDKLIRSWDKSIGYKDALLSLDSTNAEAGELLSESNLLRRQAVDLLYDLVDTYDLRGTYDSECSS